MYELSVAMMQMISLEFPVENLLQNKHHWISLAVLTLYNILLYNMKHNSFELAVDILPRLPGSLKIFS